jgi:hypothetical protein
MENELPIIVFDVGAQDGIVAAATGEEIGTRVGASDSLIEPAHA